MRLLNIVSSPRREKSASIAIANAFIDAYCRNDPSIHVDTLNVWEEDLPDFDHEAIGAKYKGVANTPLNDKEQAVWLRIKSLVTRFQEADRIVIGVPMWNFDYPYKLKQLIDLVSQRNMLFSFDGKRYGPMLKIPRALVIHVRGQSEQAGTAIGAPGFAFQADYIEFWLKLIGVNEVKTLMIEHTWDGRAQETIERGKADASYIASVF
ncbi:MULTISPECIES: FMN-dependent NADH-azoreductase [unclassified Achromobacter]|uniref:FMN-dependent NADH-azoreductase n=1 Tax=unclassified Achromobacter TaxID=2626865 RepID=UPI000B51D6C7|nr:MULTISPECIES: NAD(P)H-dependent oxidoreductase [unclassified Achromobacter]OWT76996.1 FMN-dependent NADH-azoreductase [Achromobacter sp. HZ28]OWT77876.1 FMN-dependent NADH-azoreductase [Achromobacter sp. HZ34]